MTKIFTLSTTSLSVGRMKPCHIVCSDIEEMSAIHMTFTSREGHIFLKVEGRNGVYVNGKFCKYLENVEVEYGDEVEFINLRIIWLGKYIAISTEKFVPEIMLDSIDGDYFNENVDAVEFNTGGDKDFFNPVPRMHYGLENKCIELDAPPQKRVEENTSVFMSAMPALTMALPMLIGFIVSRTAAKGSGAVSSTFMYAGIATAICSALIGVIWAVTNLKNRNRQLEALELKRKAAYLEYVKESEKKIKECHSTSAGSLRLRYPEVSDYFTINNNSHGRKLGYSQLLWNIDYYDDDFLCVRLGIGERQFDVDITIPKDRFCLENDELREIPRMLKEKYASLKDVPITVDLREHRYIGIISSDLALLNELFLVLLMEIAVKYSPSTVSIALDIKNGKIINDSLLATRFIPHLIKLTSIEQNETENTMFIIFTDSYENISRELKHREDIVIIVIADSFSSLPSECSLIIQRDENFSGYIQLNRYPLLRTKIHFDKISTREAFKYSKVLRGVTLKKSGKKSEIPKSVSFYELYGKAITHQFITSEWNKNTTLSDINIPIGIAENDNILYLNLHEKHDGPHGVLAGMTGSGKSEMLQTIILSLAVLYSPNEVGFFLIDYKGGGMSELFKNLPHLLGSISNLSGRMVCRAMASVKSENERRQRIFVENRVNNINEYHELYKNKKVEEPLPHIFIIIDEFAELKREEPEFMKELISVARVGRSLGIHLLLATQKPAGTVDDNIQSNSRFRICLKVQDRLDSMEMLKTPDASLITEPGVAYLKVGNDETYRKFKSAYTMDKSLSLKKKDSVVLYDLYGRKMTKKQSIYNEPISTQTQMDRTINEIMTAAASINTRVASRLWLEPLGKYLVYTEEIISTKKSNRQIKLSRNNESNSTNITDIYNIDVGLYDNPAQQEQKHLILNIINKGHHIILGTLQSGKSTLLSTISFALLTNVTPDMLNMYIIDFSHGALRPLKKSCMVGGYICDENEEDIEKLFLMIEELMKDRGGILNGGNYTQYLLSGKTMPAVVLIIDGIGALRERTKNEYDRNVENILKNGAALGVFVVASAISVTASEISRKLFDHFKICIPLQLKDRYEYKDALSALSEQIPIPESIRGRGLCKLESGIHEFQAYKPVRSDNDFDGINVLEEHIDKRNKELSLIFTYDYIDSVVKRIPKIPSPLTYDAFSLEEKRRIRSGNCDEKNFINVGFEKSSGKIFGIPFVDNMNIFISGRFGSGKKNLLNVIRKQVKQFVEIEHGISLDNGMKIIVYDEKKPFTELAKLKEMAGSDPYVIHLGGSIDRQNLADYSYIPYSSQIKVMEAGHGVVRKNLGGYWYGEIVIPEVLKDDSC